MTSRCPRSFEAEAWRDGRLSGAEVARFQAHAKLCASCKQEHESLEALGRALRGAQLEPDELQIRRDRTRLLAAFDAKLVPSPRPARMRWWLGAATVVVVAVLAVLLRPTAPAPLTTALKSRANPPEVARVRADGDARWSRQTQAQRETIVLESGQLSIQVAHASSGRLRVVLPDGELEDIGTTFSVSARAGRTESVRVQEGIVVLRLRGMPALKLGAGESWSAAAPLPSAAPVTPLPRLKPSGDAASLRAVPASSAAPDLTAAPQASPDPSARFRDAMAALDRGDNSQAAALFAAFAAAHPRDSRAEDASYLRVLALQRAGNHAAMRAAAGDYLRRYPGGFRRAEVAPLAREP